MTVPSQLFGAGTLLTLPGAWGAQSSVPPMLEGTLSKGKTVIPVNYNNWLVWPDDADMITAAGLLNSQILSTAQSSAQPIVVMSHSLGSIVTGRWLCLYGPTCTVSPSQLYFVQLGNSVSLYGGQLKNEATGNTPPANTPYKVIDFKREGDGWADYPDPSQSNSQYYWLACTNADAGGNSIHAYYTGVSLTDAANVSYTPQVNGSPGNITYMWSPTCPIPLYGTSNYSYADYLDSISRPQVNSAMGRPVTMPTPNYAYANGSVDGVKTPIFGS
jgi:hypothetical protein